MESISRLIHRLRFALLYLGSPPWDTGVTPPEVEAFVRANPPGRALDVGCGTGTNLLYLAKAGWAVTGVDFSARAVNLARRRLGQSGVRGEVICGDVTRFAHSGPPFDLVLDIGCFHGLPEPDREAYRRRLTGWLSPAGTYLLYVHLKNDGEARSGVTEREVQAFQALVRLSARTDSLDRFGRKAAWLEFRGLLRGDGGDEQ